MWRTKEGKATNQLKRKVTEPRTHYGPNKRERLNIGT